MKLKKVQRSQQKILDQGYITKITNTRAFTGNNLHLTVKDHGYNQVPDKKNPTVDIKFNLGKYDMWISLRKFPQKYHLNTWAIKDGDQAQAIIFDGKDFYTPGSDTIPGVSTEVIEYDSLTEAQDFQYYTSIDNFELYKNLFLIRKSIEALMNNDNCSISTVNEVIKTIKSIKS